MTIYLQDVTLRDGLHALGHQVSPEQVKTIAAGLDEAGVDAVEVAHGDGLGGSSATYGVGSHSDFEWLEAAASVLRRARLTTLLLPGIGTADLLRRAADSGVVSVRVATHCTEADVANQHIALARDLGLDASGFLMMSHMLEPEALAEQARVMEAAGADCVYIVDSAGHLTVDGVVARARAYRDRLDPNTQIGIHCHDNLSLAVAGSVAAIDAGAYRVDASLGGLGAGAGNCPIEPLAAVLDLQGRPHGVDLEALMHLSESSVRPLQRPARHDAATLTLGYAGVYSSFLLHAERAASRYGVPMLDLLRACGERGLVGGQEDRMLDIALELRGRTG